METHGAKGVDILPDYCHRWNITSRPHSYCTQLYTVHDSRRRPVSLTTRLFPLGIIHGQHTPRNTYVGTSTWSRSGTGATPRHTLPLMSSLPPVMTHPLTDPGRPQVSSGRNEDGPSHPLPRRSQTSLLRDVVSTTVTGTVETGPETSVVFPSLQFVV